MNNFNTCNRRTLLRTGLDLAMVAAAPALIGCAATSGARQGFFAAHDLPIGIQLYMLGDEAVKDLEGTLQRLAAIGYRSIEIPGIRAGSAVTTRAAADQSGLVVSSVHIGANRLMSGGNLLLQDDAAVLAAELHTLGCRDVVMPFPLLPEVTPEPGEDLPAALKRAFTTSADPWKRTAEFLNDRAEALKGEGLSLGYHNHSFEFLPVGDTTGWDILVAETDPELVSFEVDVGWVTAGAQDSTSFMAGLAGRVRQLHVKDLHAPAESGISISMNSTEVGNGIVDWNSVLPAAYEAGARQFYVEQEPPYLIDRFEAATRSFNYLSRL